MNQAMLQLRDLTVKAAEKQALKKAVFSKPADRTEQKTVLTLRMISGKLQFQAERFGTDNKATHRNFEAEETAILEELISSHGQVNLFTSAGDCELRRSKKGEKITLLGGDKLLSRLEACTCGCVSVEENNRGKQRILDGSEEFLKYLDVSDKNGRIHDKKQSKFRQINRFLELIRDCLPHLPKEGPLRICDLCCGKSYLSFAAYHYFTAVLGREVRMTGVDLKSDVIAYCSKVAKDLHFDGLEFLCGDVSKYDTPEHVNLVISLHACDIATDFVLERAVHWDADVILSTPCCHHELNHSINCPELSFITDHSMLRQKLCDAATDALRLKFLEGNCYEVTALELIDPEETPKNIMLRGLRKRNLTKDSPSVKQAMEDYLSARTFLTGGNGNVQGILCPPLRK